MNNTYIKEMLSALAANIASMFGFFDFDSLAVACDAREAPLMIDILNTPVLIQVLRVFRAFLGRLSIGYCFSK